MTTRGSAAMVLVTVSLCASARAVRAQTEQTTKAAEDEVKDQVTAAAVAVQQEKQDSDQKKALGDAALSEHEIEHRSEAQRELKDEDQRIVRMESAYKTVRSLVGANHSVLTSMIVTGRRCDARSWTVCLSSSYADAKGGVVGFVGVPLLGGRRGHWLDFFPRVQSDSVVATYAGFESHVRSYRALVAQATAKEDEESALNSFNRLAPLFEQQLKDDAVEDPDWRESDAEGQVECEKCKQNREKSDLPAGTAGRLLGCLRQLESYVAQGPKGDGIAASAGLQQLEALWREYELLSNRPRSARQEYLVSILGGAPIYEATSKYVNDLLYGVGVEFGPQALHIYLGAGLRADWDRPWRALGSWAGIGLSGQLGDNLIYAVKGLHAASGELQ